MTVVLFDWPNGAAEPAPAETAETEPSPERVGAEEAVRLAQAGLFPGEALASLGLIWAASGEPSWNDVAAVIAACWVRLEATAPRPRTPLTSVVPVDIDFGHPLARRWLEQNEGMG